MKIAICGTGYVGLVTGTCFAEKGHEVVCLDIDEKKIEMLKKGQSPIYEPGLEDLLEKNIKANRIRFTLDAKKAVEHAEVIFIAVPTLCDETGNADLQHIVAISETIGRFMCKPLEIVVKSTVPVGTTEQVKSLIDDMLQKREVTIDFKITFNPEFLKEGHAVNDCLHPDRIILGTEGSPLLEQLYADDSIIRMDIPSAEMSKYAANCMLATRISLMNEFAGICERVGADINAIRKGIGSDPRIGPQFLNAGVGFGGSCFPKDLSALRAFSKRLGYKTEILDAVTSVNTRQKNLLFEKLNEHFPSLLGKTIAIWGLAFKPGTDDIREAPSIELISALNRAGAKVQLFDPVAMKKMSERFPDAQYCENEYDSTIGADAIALLTEWKQFKEVDFARIVPLMKSHVFFDGRNQFSAKQLEATGFDYYGIGIPHQSHKNSRQKT